MEARREHRERFNLIDRISDQGQAMLPMFAGFPRKNQYLVTGALFMRGLQTLQGAILMAERVMILEARTLVRSCYETLFYLGASVMDPDFSQRIGLDHLARMEGLSRAHAKWSDMEDVADLKTAIDVMKEGHPKGKELRIVEVAEAADMRMRYDAFYKGLSNDSAHPSLMSLRSAWDMDEASSTVRGLQWGPGPLAPDRIDDTLELIALVGIDLMDQANILLKSDKVMEAIKPLSDEYLVLHKASHPDSN